MEFNDKLGNIIFPNIALEIKEMVNIDQKMREQMRNDENYFDEEVDSKNTARMKEIIKEIGFPSISKVGKEGASNAWLLIQHADHDIDFQKEYLQLMKNAPPNEVNKINIAYLEDRVLVNQNKGQLYGTQFAQENGKHIPIKIEDEVNVDKRRADMGMGTLSEQIELMNEKYPIKNDK